MTAQLFYPPILAVLSRGLPAAGAKATFYLAGTTIKTPIYTTAALDVEHPNPVLANGAGVLPPIYLRDDVVYRLVITDAAGVTITQVDPYTAGTVSSPPGPPGPPGSGNIVGLAPEDFGALGNGSANDTMAFQQLAAAINAAGGGAVTLRPGAVYLVGIQDKLNDGEWMWKGRPIFDLLNCTKPVVVEGNGATMKFAPNMKFGTFNAAGTVTTHTQPYYTIGEKCAPTPSLGAMMSATGCLSFTARNIILDGQAPYFSLGGGFGDTGWQLPGDGILLYSTGTCLIEDCKFKDFPRDGLLILDGTLSESSTMGRGIVRRCDFDSNCRQGLSFVGGSGYLFENNSFKRTGRGAFTSAPSAGIDLESEVGYIRNIHIENCDFDDNAGAGLVADSGNTRDVMVKNSRFIGTVAPGVWPNKPGFTFEKCKFVGGIAHSWGDAVVNEAAKYTDCTFTDDPAHSPSGVVYGPTIVNLGGGGANVLFERCTIDGGHSSPGYAFDSSGVILRDTTVTGGGGACLNPRIEGRVSLPASLTGGAIATPVITRGATLTVNGVVQRKGSKTYDPPSLADGTRASTTITVPGTVSGDLADASFGLDLQGIRLGAYVSAAATVTVVFENRTGGTIDLASGTLRAWSCDLAA